MNKKIISADLLLFPVSLMGCSNQNNSQNKSSKLNQEQNKQPETSRVDKSEFLKVSFCPTMREEAISLKNKNENIKLVQLGSASEVLRNLNSKTIDAGIIGRKAKKSEITEKIKGKRLHKVGYTLIGPRKQMIPESNLKNLQISTCLGKEIKESFPELNLDFVDCDYKNGRPWLISWDDFSDELELLIPVNENGEKIKIFRTAHLYTSLDLDNFTF